MPEPVLEVQALTRRFGDFVAVMLVAVTIVLVVAGGWLYPRLAT